MDKKLSICDYCRKCFDDSEYEDGYLRYVAIGCEDGNETFESEDKGGIGRQKCEGFEPITFDYHIQKVTEAEYSDSDILTLIEEYFVHKLVRQDEKEQVCLEQVAKEIMRIVRRAKAEEDIKESDEWLMNRVRTTKYYMESEGKNRRYEVCT